ncbi:asparaginase [Actinoplanes sp. NPDC049265]|uniref:asparaginase n=1 Tax=Actinoplanes sp. NPDC049265 TaxID=3363902 RepID=UPI003710A9F0
MSTERVAVASLGGTITMTSAPDGTAALPVLTATDLVSAVPGLSGAAEVTAHTIATIPGASLPVPTVLEALSWARRAVDDGARGAVIVQGTDTIDESAYLMDLYWDRDAPLVVTGAMRTARTAGADGPANILAATRVAVSPASRARGVLVVMNDEIHAASRVRKTRSSGLNAFRSTAFGPLGYLEETAVVYGNSIRRIQPLPAPGTNRHPRVALIGTHLDDDGALLDLVVASDYQGAVVAAFGAGHVSEQLAQAASRAVAASKPVVLASRTGAGTTFTRTYGFAGSESDLLRRGAVLAGWLDATKARLLLACLISASSSMQEIESEFRRRGQPSAPVLRAPAERDREHA